MLRKSQTYYSRGKGDFFKEMPSTGLKIAFGLTRISEFLEIEIYDDSLEKWLRKFRTLCGCQLLQCDCLGVDSRIVRSTVSSNGVFPSVSMDDLLSCYREVSEEFDRYKTEERMFESLELFVDHFLREGSVLAKFGFEDLYGKQILTEPHFHDIRHQYSSMFEDLVRLDKLVSEVDESGETNEPVKPVVLGRPSSSLPVHQDRPVEGRSRSDLRGAIAQRDATKVANVLSRASGVVDSRDLCYSIDHYDNTVFCVLLDHGAQVNGDAHKTPPMYDAAKAGNLRAVRLLLEHGAQVNADAPRASPSIRGLRIGVDPVYPNLYDKKPLTGAVIGGHLEIVKYLVEEHGAEIHPASARDTYPWLFADIKDPSLLSCAVTQGHREIFAYLLGAIDHQPQQDGGCPSSEYLIPYEERRWERLRNFQQPTLTHGFQFFSSPPSPSTSKSIDFQEHRKSHEIVVPEISNQTWDLLLSIGPSEKYLDVIGFLVTSGMDIGTIRGDSQLYRATSIGRLESVRDLLQGPRIVPTADVVLLIWRAAENGHLHVLDFLLDYDLNAYPTLLSLVTHLATKSATSSYNTRVCQTSTTFDTIPGGTTLFLTGAWPRGYCNSPDCPVKRLDTDLYPSLQTSYVRNAKSSGANTLGTLLPTGCPNCNVIEALDRYQAKLNDEGSCPAIAAIRDQERRTKAGIPARRLLDQVKKSRDELLNAGDVPDSSGHLKRFVGRIGTPKSIWKCGTRAFRDIIEGYMPSALPDVVSALQVADAMRLVVPPSNTVWSKEE